MANPAGYNAPTSLLSVILNYALHTPMNDFLVEDKGVSLPYNRSYALITQLIPTRLRILSPSLVTSSNPTAVLLTHNCSLFSLAVLSLWSMSVVVVPISTSADPSLWAGMIQLIDPDIVLVSQNLMEPFRKSLEENNSVHVSPEIINIKSLIPPEFLLQTDTTTRTSDFIPSCHRWLNHAYTDSDALTDSPLPTVQPEARAVTLFTSSAVDCATLKCVSYTHKMLVISSARTILMLGGESYSSRPKRHLGWLPLSHCFEFCLSFCGIVIYTGGAYLFFDRQVSSPSLPPSTALPTLLLSGLAYHAPVTAFATMPSILRDIVQECTNADVARLRALESLGVGGARTPESLFQWAASQDIPYFDSSGATEAVGTICIRRALETSQRQNGLQVIPDFMGTLEKANLSDNFGELIIRGTHLPTGYDNREDDAFHFDLASGITTYRTGDLYSHQDHLPVLSHVVGGPIPPYDETREVLSGLSYIGRIDDLVVLGSGIKIDAISLERKLDAHAAILRSALMESLTGDALVALIQPQAAEVPPAERVALIEAVQSINISLPFEKRLRRENIYLVHDLPVTTKFTLNRKMLKKIFSRMHGDNDIPTFFPPPPSPSLTIISKGSSATLPHIISKQISSSSAGIRVRLAELLARIFSVPKSHFDLPGSSLIDLPLTSLSSVQLVKALHDEFAVSVTSAQLYGTQTMNDLCDVVSNISQDVSFTAVPASISPTVSVRHISEDRALSANSPNIVISGAACRFVGGIDSLDSLWSAILSPDAFLKQVPRERPNSRWEQPHANENMMFSSGWLEESAIENVCSFAEFFGFSPQEARAMSPNARLALQLGYQAIEDAGIAPRTLSGKNWGIFTSVNDSGWRERRMSSLGLHEYALGIHGSADDAVGARLSYFLNLTGPAMEIKSACSSSAVAIHQACSAIRNGDCEAAVVISATTHFHPAGAIFRSQNGIASVSGRCVPFSASADGFVASEGAAAIVLQKAEDANCMEYGSIRSTAVTQDGMSRGFFAPNPKAQSRLLMTALEKGCCSANDISMLEAHGTGTRLGDAIELQAIHETLSINRKTPLYIGSVKAVLGHTEECAGLAGVLKTLLCLSNNALPPQPRTGPLNDAIDISLGTVVIPSKITAFLPRDQPRLCGVSSFGLSGTLAHIIVQEARPETPRPANAAPHVFVLSARNTADYLMSIRKYFEFFNAQHLQANRLESVCRTTQVGRDHFLVRRAWTVASWRGLIDALDKALTQPPPLTLPMNYRPKIGLWFGLPLFRRSLGPNDHSLFHLKTAECWEAGWAPDYEYFVQQLALALCLAELGCEICVVGGEGITEYVAGVFAGIIPRSAIFRILGLENHDDRIVAARCARSVLNELLMTWRTDELRIIGQHGPELFTLRGTKDAIAALATRGGVTIDLDKSLPPPTVLTPMDMLRPPTIPIISSHLCEALDEETVSNFDYWSHVQDRDVYADTAWDVMASKCDIVVSIGQADDISDVLGDRCFTNHQNSLENIVGALFQAGCFLDWEKFVSWCPRAHIPPYSFATDIEYDAARRSI